MQEGIESTGKFVVSGGDATELLESIEEALNQMASPVAMPVDRPFVFPIATGRNVGASARRFDGLDQFVTVIAFVGSNLTTYHVLVPWKNLGRGSALAARLKRRRRPRLNHDRALR